MSTFGLTFPFGAVALAPLAERDELDLILERMDEVIVRGAVGLDAAEDPYDVGGTVEDFHPLGRFAFPVAARDQIAACPSPMSRPQKPLTFAR
jgi:hypothetical protein